MEQGLEIRVKDIVGLTCDSRQVKPGFLFAALPGTNLDGRNFIADAMKRGAVAVLAAPGTRIESPERKVPLLIDDNPRRRFALMAARFFAKQPSTIAAVTGTNGKTSVVSFVRQIWTHMGRKAASMGTLGINAAVKDTRLKAIGNLTTPDPVELHRGLSILAEADINHLVLEASSHGLVQHRLDAVNIDVAAFTNIGREHLDYHGSMGDYLAAKERLFTEIMKPAGIAVLNADSDCFAALSQTAEIRRQRVIAYGRDGADIRLEAIEPLPDGQRLKLLVNGKNYQVLLPLIGSFQAENALCALAIVLACGENQDAAVKSLEILEEVPGRAQKVAVHPCGASIYVDYAHTPDALACILEALRRHTLGRLLVVFGCGGERDTGKRSQMGRIASQLADEVIVTDDNPRGEDAALIRAQIIAACKDAREIGDRGEAIAKAIDDLQSGDLLVIAGKGHETGQIVNGQTLAFNDAQVVQDILREGKS